MKKAAFIAMSLMLVAQVSFAQIFTSSFENWSGPNSPDGWIGNTVASNTTNILATNVIQSSDAQEGILSCQLVNTSTGTSNHRRFTTSAVNVTQGQIYTISFWAKGNAQLRLGIVTLNSSGAAAYGTYTPYSTIVDTWTQYSFDVTANNTSLGEFIFSLHSTVAPSHLLIDNVVITDGNVTPPTDYVSIYDIQYTTAMSGDSPYVGQTVETSGIVTATYASGYFIQNGVGPWTGVHVFNNSNTPQIGDSISIIGNVVEYFNLTQITSVTSFVNHSSGNTLPVAVEITSAQSKTEPYEGVLVKVMNAECTNVNSGFGMWKINSGVDSSKVHNLFYAYTPILGASYNIRGVINYSFSEFRVCPRNINDIEVLNANVNDVSIYEIQFTTAADGASPLVGQTVTTSGIVTATVATASNTGFFIQDGVGPWNGIFVANNSINPTVGDEIELTGVVGESFGLTRISGVSGHTIVSSGNALPAPTVISTQAVNTEPYESVLIRVQNTTCTNTNAGFGMFRVNDGSGDALVDDELFSFTPVLGNGYNVQGLLWFSFGEFKIWPRFASDIETIGFASLEGNELNQVVLYPNPAEETLNVLNYEGQVLVLDAQGRVILVNEVSAAQNQINVANLVAGVYFAVIDGQTIRFVKR
jgi:predicted extracellular nuclease